MRHDDAVEALPRPGRSARLLVAAAKSELSEALATSALARNLAVHLWRGDLLDLVEPSALLADVDVVLVPFGQGDTTHVDFSFDLQAAIVLGDLAGAMRARRTELLLVGRAPGALASQPARLLAERAALFFYAMHTELLWNYVDPWTSIDSGRPRLAGEWWARPSELADAPELGEYAGRVVDLAARLAPAQDDGPRLASTARRGR